jgi:tetratricopeptide (TPR) repeat protein
VRLLSGVGLILLLISVASARADDTQDLNNLFNEACDLYEASEFDGALQIFESLVSNGVKNASVYYNLGNCYYQIGEVGKAVLNYKRALILAPRDEDVRANLDFLRSSVGLRDTTDSFGLSALAQLPGRIASPREWQMLFYVGYYLSAVCLLAVLFVGGLPRRYALRALSVLVVFAIACWLFAERGRSRFSSGTEGVVVVNRSEFMSGPGAAFDELARLPDGAEVSLRTRSGIWMEVKLTSGEIGWVKESNLETL